MALTKTQVSELYVAIFNRASEGDGNTFWQTYDTTTTAVETSADVANAMLATSDAATYFGTSLDSDQAFIEHIYLNTLNKTITDDPDGIAFWVAKLTAGDSRGSVVAELVYAATQTANAGTAQDQFNNRVTVSDYTADTLTAAPTDYATSLSFTSSGNPTGALTVDNTAASVTTANAAVDDLAPTTFTLTSDVSSVLEGAQATFTVTASKAVTTDTAVTFNVVVDDSAAADQGTNSTNLNDFAAGTFNPSIVTIASGATTATFTVTGANDGLTELPENYSVTADVTGATQMTKTMSMLDGAGTFTLTTGVDSGSAFTGGIADDTFTAGDINGTATWTTGDAVDGGAGTDTFNVVTAGAIAIPTAATVTNIETMNATSGSTVTLDTTTGFSGLTSLATTSIDGATVTAASTTAVSVTDAMTTGGGGKAVAVNGGSTVSVTTTNNILDTITVGATTAATGTVTVTSTGGTADTNTNGTITVTGGTTVNVTQNAGNAAATGNDTFGGVVTVNGDSSTTAVTVTQTATATGATAVASDGVVGFIAGAVNVLDANRASTTAAGTIATATVANAGATTVDSGALTTLNLEGTLTTVNAGTLGALTTAANSTLALNLTGAVSTGAITIDADITTLNISGNTTTSTINSLVANGATTVNVAGDALVTLTGNTLGAITDIIVTNTAGASFGTALGTAVNFTGGAGDDTVSLGTTTKAITMGDGNDTVTTSSAAVGTGGSVDAGAGTNDTIIMTTALAATADNNSTFNSKYTNFETLKISDANTNTLDLDGLNQVTSVILAAGSNGGTINNIASGGAVTTLASNGGTTAIGVTAALGGTSDVLNYNMLKTGGVLAAGAVTVANVETINISVADAATAGSNAVIHTLTLTANAATSVVVTGNNGLALTATGSTAITNMDASGVVANNTAATSTAAATTDTAANLAVTYTSLNTTTTADVTIKGGEGNDTLTGAAAKDTITGGEGADIIDGKAGVDVIVLTETTAAVDTVSFTVPGALNTSANADTITDFKTTSDKLSFNAITVTGGGAITAVAGTAVTSGVVTAGAITDDSIYVISDGATSLTAAGVETIATYTDLTDVAAFLAEGYTSTADNDAGIFLINDLVADKTYAYIFDEQTAGASTIQAADLALLGVITEVAGAALVAGDIA